MSVDYRRTVFLPETGFAMKAELPQREPLLLARWAAIDLYGQVRARAAGRPRFVLHDGPPYANGDIHIGTALNKILKDIVVRSQQMLGRDAVYVPGWDCHGLPIEWKIEEKYRAEKRSKDQVPIVEFRQECRAFAQHWLDVQRGQFKRLGGMGDWDRPYITMAFAAEAQIAREIGKFLMNGGLYRGAKPVLWSVVEKTALAEAEVEYHDHTSRWIYVRFPIVEPSVPALAGAAAVIWTTTPWTMPGNRAIAYGPGHDYAVIAVGAAGEAGHARAGERILVASALLDAFTEATGIASYEIVAQIPGRDLAGTVAAHPFRGQGYEFPVPLLPGDHVTTEAGTGLVHTAPGHGEEDWAVGQAHGLGVPETVDADGRYFDHVPLFAGASVYTPYGKPGTANAAVIEALAGAGALLAEGSFVHAYPHSWRSKSPLIYRTTPQWFIAMETPLTTEDGKTGTLRDKALGAIGTTKWYPPQGQTRIQSMVESRPDWCVSRQRAWGVPISVFVDRRTREPLRDQAVIDRIADAFEAEGADAWYASPPERFLGPGRDPGDFEQVRDVVDVWFDSGSTHAFVLEQRADLGSPADLYLEGSDQHRGWFQSSLLESCGTRGRAPYKAVLTHGFTLDEQGRKMSKSLGNTTAPSAVIGEHGADVLRLWVVASNYLEDQRIGKNILKFQVDVYRRFRNTLRYLLGALGGYSPEEALPAAAMPALERVVLHRLAELDRVVRDGAARFDFHTHYIELHQFCAVDLSAFYFDIRKDSLYCDRPDDLRRCAARSAMAIVFDALVKWLAPILCFTAEEAWLAWAGDGTETSVHLETYPAIPSDWANPELARKWQRLRDLRRVVTGAIEVERAAKRLGSSLQAEVTIYVDGDAGSVEGAEGGAGAEGAEGVDLAELCIVSAATLSRGPAPAGAFALPDVPGVAVAVGLAPGEKCQRCWRVLPEVTPPADSEGEGGLCARCLDAVAHHRSAAAA